MRKLTAIHRIRDPKAVRHALVIGDGDIFAAVKLYNTLVGESVTARNVTEMTSEDALIKDISESGPRMLYVNMPPQKTLEAVREALADRGYTTDLVALVDEVYLVEPNYHAGIADDENYALAV